MKRQEGTAKARRLAALRKRIAKVQGKAKFVGMLYLLATIAMLALSCFPVFTVDGTQEGWLWVLTFWTPFTALMDMANLTVEKVQAIIVSAIYVLILLVLLVNVFRSFSKLGWLFKKKPSKQNGHNRNAYAMEDMGKIFSSSFGAVVFWNFVIFLLTQANGATVNVPNVIAIPAVGLFIHFVCGHIGGNVSLFVADEDVLTEEARECGRVAPIVRNLLQLAVVGAIGYMMILTNEIGGLVKAILGTPAADLMAAPMQLLPGAVQIISLLFFAVLITHATNVTEFDSEGVEAAGMKNFRVFAFLLILTSAGAWAVKYFLFQVWVNELLIAAAIALVAFIIEVIMRNMPSVKQDDPDEMDMDEYLEAVSHNGFAAQYDDGSQYDTAAAFGLQPMYPQTNYGFENYYNISEEY